MKRNRSSLTAEGIAFSRAWESRRPAGERICYDPLAQYFVSPTLKFLMNMFYRYAQWRSPGVTEFLACRTRFIDDYLQDCLDHGLRQLVVLGAGFDTRPYRFADLKGQVKVFEVDHPATQTVKIERLVKLFGKLPDHVTFVPIDFNEQTLEERLPACGYDPALKTLFIWEGVVYYISDIAVDATLAFIAGCSLPGSSVVFDYIYTAALRGEMPRYEVRNMRRYRRFTGEGLVFGIEKGTIAAFLGQRGFYQIFNADASWLRSHYLTGANASRPLAPAYALVHAEVK